MKKVYPLLKQMIGIRKIGFFTISVAILVFVGTGSGEEKEEKHPIDVWLKKCIEKDSSTAGMINCSEEALKKWDEELNKTYKALMRKLKPDEKEALKQSQLQWIKFRDAEFRFLDKFYDKFTGSMYPVMKAGDRLGIVKSRVQELKVYLKLLEEE